MPKKFVLDDLAEVILKDARAIKWPPHEPKVRQSWVDYLKTNPRALMEEAEHLESSFGGYTDAMNDLGNSMFRLSFGTGSIEERLTEVQDNNTLMLRKKEDFLNKKWEAKCLLSVCDNSYPDKRVMEEIAWIYALNSEFGHDTMNYIGSTWLFSRNLEKEKLKMVSATGRHIINISMSIGDSIHYIVVDSFPFESDIVSPLSDFFNVNYPSGFNIEYENHRSDNSDNIVGGRFSLYRVFYNLVNNAMKRGKANKVKIVAFDDTLNGSDVVKLQVVDNGTGLPGADDIFTRGISYSGGTGFGLALARRIIYNHHGTITPIAHYNDPIYKGACFTVVLPKEQKEKNLVSTREL